MCTLTVQARYQPGDHVLLFGFSRGVYTARALAGLLRTVGLLRPGADNLVWYALKLYTEAGRRLEDNEVLAAARGVRGQVRESPVPNRFAECDRYLVSTDGSTKSRHPDPVAMARIVTRRDNAVIEFNYRSETTQPWVMIDRPELPRPVRTAAEPPAPA